MGIFRKKERFRTARSQKSANPHNGVWFHHRGRFLRAVDKYYETTVRLNNQVSSNQLFSEPSAHRHAAEIIAAQTIVLNELADRVQALTHVLQERFPLWDMVVPAAMRSELGNLPENFAKAATKVAEANGAATMALITVQKLQGNDAYPAHTSSGDGVDSGASRSTSDEAITVAHSSVSYVQQAAALIMQCEKCLEVA